MAASASEMLLVDEIADEFESQWRRGLRPAIAPYLDRVPNTLRAPTLSELVQVDLEYRRKHGDAPSFREYREQFPADFQEPEAIGPVNAESGEFFAIGRYFVISRLAVSGQAEVFLAVHPTPATVVLKFLRRGLDPALESCIRREARVLAQLNHPNIARVTDVDRHEGRSFLAVTYVPGRTLDQYVKDRALSQREAALMVASVARIVAAAHDEGISHLDIKPKNIVIDSRGEPHVIDFGAAWASNTLQDDAAEGAFLAGTLAFMSPEQARGDVELVGVRSDLFGLGTLLYYLVASKAPFAAPDIRTARQRAMRCEHPPLPREVSIRLRHIVAKAMAADPDERPRDARTLATELEKFAEIPDRRRRVLLATGVAVAAGLALFGAFMLADHRPSRQGPAPDPALELKVFRNGELVELSQAIPVRVGDQIKVEASSPHGTFAAMWIIDSGGEVGRVEEILADSSDRAMNHPPTGKRASVDSLGNWTAVCLTSRAGEIGDEDFSELLDGAPDCSLLPGDTMVKMTGTTVNAQKYGSRKPLHLTPDAGPDVPARLFLEHLRTGAVSRGYGVQAITFSVVAP